MQVDNLDIYGKVPRWKCENLTHSPQMNVKDKVKQKITSVLGVEK